MKKKVALATLAMIPMTISNAYASGQIGIVTTSSLNVRSGPSTNNSVLFTAKKNEKVNINETSNGWYKIKNSSGKEGWASSTYISVQNGNDSNQGNTSNSSGIKKQVNTNGLNMRSGAGTSYRVITKLNKGTQVEVISQSNGWTKIKYDGRLGYVSSQYLDEIKNQETSKTNKVVNTDSLNVRSGPSTSYSVVGKLKKGENIGVISESNGWSKIDYKGKIAYTSSKYLINSSSPSNPTPPPTTETPKPEAVKETKVVNTDSLNVRSGAGTNYSKVGTLKKGEKVGVISESNGWSKIDYKGKVAYTSSQYLSKENTSTPQPPTPEPPITPETNPGEDTTENVNGATINNKALSYTLNDHLNVQLERVNEGANVIDSSRPRSSEVMTTFMIRESRAFVPANKSDLEYFLNPDNFRNSSKGMLQFLRIDTYKGGVSSDELNSYLNSLAPTSSGTNVFYNQGQVFINAAQKYNIDLAYLVSHAMWETGYGKSALAQGQTITSYKGQPLAQPVTVYNFFGIGAIDKSANVSGAEAAYSNGWTSIEATIDGSAEWIAQNYVKSSKYNQNTIYKMKFNYDYAWHQYATDVNWANGISGIMIKIIGMYDTGSNLVFEVPNYKK
ncbi:MAG: SH3 domain-containing protein [Romboutsia sp.]|uniref:SH3 domain-containing protein n=1 Tax=Romboutsia sp. TaxID=1965302 RepID=UPI003F307C8B